MCNGSLVCGFLRIDDVHDILGSGLVLSGKLLINKPCVSLWEKCQEFHLVCLEFEAGHFFVAKFPCSKWEARTLEMTLIEICDDQMLVKSCTLALLMVILMRLAKEPAQDA